MLRPYLLQKSHLNSINAYLKCCLHSNSNGRAYFQRLDNKPLLYRNIGEQIQRAADIFADKPAFVACLEQRSLTFLEAKKEGEKLAIQLAQLGLKPGDHLGIWAPNTVQWYVTFYAAAMGGFPLICLNPALQAQELAFQLQKAKVKAIVTMDKHKLLNFEKVLETILPNRKANAESLQDKNFPHLRHVLVHGENVPEGFINYNELMENQVKEQDRQYLNDVLVPSISPEQPCNIQFTSGTTGQPKAALLNHYNHVNMGYLMGENIGVNHPNTKICLTVPLFHAYGMGMNMAALHYGSTIVAPSPTFNSKACLEATEKEKCTFIVGTPTMFVDMIQVQKKLNKNLESLKYGTLGGAACSPQTYKDSKEILGIEQLLIAYGQSECTTATFCQLKDIDAEEAATTIGTLAQHMEAKVVNEKGETVRFGERGELCIRGFCTMIGYFEDEEKTKETKTVEGWIKTGDEVCLNENGVARILGRRKEMLIRGGENIFPKEIEDFLDTHPDILESQVIGVPCERLGEDVCAYLRLRPGSKPLTEADIREFCKGNIAHFKIPKYVRLIEEYPKTNSGKIQKFKLLEMFKQNK